MKKTAAESINEDFLAKVQPFILPKDVARTLHHKPCYVTPVEKLMKIVGKDIPDDCLAIPIAGRTSLTPEGGIYLIAPWSIVDIKGLAILAHETKHTMQYRNLELMLCKPDWLIELEAECFSYRFLKENGFQIPKEIIQEGKDYVERYIKSDVSKRDVVISEGLITADEIQLQKFVLPDKNIVLEWIRNPYFTDEIINLVP